MRFFRLVLVLLLFSAGELTMAQSQPDTDPPANQEVDLSKTVHLFPNPATEFIEVQFDHFPAADVDLTVHTIIGNELPVESEVIDEHVLRIKVKELAPGYYLLAVKDEKSKFRGTYKFLKR